MNAPHPIPDPAPRVAIVVPVRNRRDKTLRFLEQFDRQTYSAHRLYIVDSNSSDGTPDAIRAARPDAAILAATDDDYWTGATNIGVTAALRDGVDYILTINDDSIVLEDFVARMVGIALAYRLPILGARIDYMQRPGCVWSIGAAHHWGTAELFCTNYGGLREEDLPPLVRSAEILPVESMPGNGVLIHRDAFAQLGLYNARFTPHYHADTEFMLRAWRHGIVPMVTPQVVVYNDFDVPEPKLVGVIASLRGFQASLTRVRSHWYIVPHLYIVLRYCPPGQRLNSIRRYLYTVYSFNTAGVGLRSRLIGRLRHLVAHRLLGRMPRLRRRLGTLLRRILPV